MANFKKREPITAVEIDFQGIGRDNTVTASNVVLTNSYRPKINKVEFVNGSTTLHGVVDLEQLFDDEGLAYRLVEGNLNELIQGILSLIGYSPTQQMVESTFSDFKQVLYNSVIAHAMMFKMWQIQSGRQAQDAVGRNLGTQFFYLADFGGDFEGGEDFTVFDPTTGVSTINTEFDDNISNAVWQNEFITKLSYVYTNKSIRALLIQLFAPIFSIVEGSTARTSYMNVWPEEWLDSNETTMKAEYDKRVNKVRSLINNNQALPQVLSYLGFQVGTDFDFTRDMAQRTVIIEDYNPLAEFLTVNSNVFQTETFLDAAQSGVISSRVLLHDSTPLSLNNNVVIEMATISNLLRRAFQIESMNIQNMLNDGTTTMSARPFILNYDFRVVDPNKESSLDALKKAYRLNRRVAGLQSDLDYDVTYTIILQIADNLQMSLEAIDFPNGYGTFLIDESSLALARMHSASAVTFGAKYKDALIKMLNAIPKNIVKTV